MKMTKSDYGKLAEFLDFAVETIGKKKLNAHKAKGLGKDKSKRFRWDLWNAAYRLNKAALTWQCDCLYRYLNDTHIDTALKYYVKTNNL